MAAQQGNYIVHSYFHEFFDKPFHAVDIFCRGHGYGDVGMPCGNGFLRIYDLYVGLPGIVRQKSACVACATTVYGCDYVAGT